MLEMQKYRFPSADIYITEKNVQFCGKTLKKTKKKVRWRLIHRSAQHEIEAVVSFRSGKKKLTHNGLTIVDTSSGGESMTGVLIFGTNRMVVSVDKNTEEMFLGQGDTRFKGNIFSSWTNVYSGKVKPIYEKFYNQK